MEWQCLSPEEFRKRIDSLTKITQSRHYDIKIKLGFTDHPAPKGSEPIFYPGTDTRDDYTNWNVSTEIRNKEIRANLYNS